jgi:hypothetical protein
MEQTTTGALLVFIVAVLFVTVALAAVVVLTVGSSVKPLTPLPIVNTRIVELEYMQ